MASSVDDDGEGRRLLEKSSASGKVAGVCFLDRKNEMGLENVCVCMCERERERDRERDR